MGDCKPSSIHVAEALPLSQLPPLLAPPLRCLSTSLFLCSSLQCSLLRLRMAPPLVLPQLLLPLRLLFLVLHPASHPSYTLSSLQLPSSYFLLIGSLGSQMFLNPTPRLHPHHCQPSLAWHRSPHPPSPCRQPCQPRACNLPSHPPQLLLQPPRCFCCKPPSPEFLLHCQRPHPEHLSPPRPGLRHYTDCLDPWYPALLHQSDQTQPPALSTTDRPP